MRLSNPQSKVTMRQMSTKGTTIESLHKKMNPLGKTKLDSLLRTSQVNLILDCPKKWIPCCLWSIVR